MAALSFTTTDTAAPASRSPGAAQKRSSSLRRQCCVACASLCQRDALKRTDDVVWAFFSHKTFVVARAEIPAGSFVVVVTIKSPNAAHHDQATDAVVPKIADVMETQ